MRSRFLVFCFLSVVTFVPLSLMSTVICPTCNLPGHRRITHRDCLSNPNRLATRLRNEEEFNDNCFRRVQVCASCGQPSHLHRSSTLCPLNPIKCTNNMTDIPAITTVNGPQQADQQEQDQPEQNDNSAVSKQASYKTLILNPLIIDSQYCACE